MKITALFVIVLVGACGKSAPKADEAPSESQTADTEASKQDDPKAEPDDSEPDDSEPTPPAPTADGNQPEKKTAVCDPMASDFSGAGDGTATGVVCTTSWECEEISVDVGCFPKKGDKATVVCECSSIDFDDEIKFEMPRSGCDTISIETINERCKPPVKMVERKDGE